MATPDLSAYRPGRRDSDPPGQVHVARVIRQGRGRPDLGTAVCGAPVWLLGGRFPVDGRICEECLAKLNAEPERVGRQFRMGL